MANQLDRFQQPPPIATRISRREARAHRSIDANVDLERHQIQAQAAIGVERVRAATRVGTRAVEAQAIVSMTERLIVEMEPGAVHGVAYLSQRLTIALGQVIDKTVEELC